MIERDHVNRLLRQHWAGKPLPVDPFYLALAEGLSCRCVTLSEYGQGSAYVRHGPAGTVVFNPSLPAVVQRAMVAHQLGHHVLGHPSQPFQPAALAHWTLASPADQAAHRFALELLMPVGSVQMLVVDQGITDLGTLMQHFAVSEAGLRERLVQLGYLPR